MDLIFYKSLARIEEILNGNTGTVLQGCQ